MAAESPFHVLAVDDCLLYRKVIEKLLKKSSFRVTVVDSGAKALEFLRLNQVVDSNDPHSPSSSENHQDLEVNLILTDYCMPGMTGYDLLKKIKETPLLRHLPVVIMSSENVPSRITECLDEGAEEFLLKPVREADLNRLKPLMMRTKLKNQVHEQIRKPEIKEDVSVKPEDLSAQEQEQEQQEENQQEEEQQQQEEEQLQEEEEEENQQEEEQQPVNNKRKEALEEGITQDRSRPRYDEITSFV